MKYLEKDQSEHGGRKWVESENELVLRASLNQAWANYGPGTLCGQLSFLISPSKLEEMILIVSNKIAVCHPNFFVFKE